MIGDLAGAKIQKFHCTVLHTCFGSISDIGRGFRVHCTAPRSVHGNSDTFYSCSTVKRLLNSFALLPRSCLSVGRLRRGAPVLFGAAQAVCDAANGVQVHVAVVVYWLRVARVGSLNYLRG